MPKINVYVSDELADAVKEANLPVSAICQRALEQAVRRVAAIHETMRRPGADLGAQFGRLTARTRTMIGMAIDEARVDGRPVGTDHLLAALIDEGAGLGLRVLRTMEIEPQELGAALASRHAPRRSSGGSAAGQSEDGLDDDAAEFAPDAKEALRLAVTEAMGLGHNYVGSEHLLLGLIAEPDGPAGQLLRAAGAELRLARRAVTAALAGWAARAEWTVPAGNVDMIAALNAAVRDQLAPITARLDRLERDRDDPPAA